MTTRSNRIPALTRVPALVATLSLFGASVTARAGDPPLAPATDATAAPVATAPAPAAAPAPTAAPATDAERAPPAADASAPAPSPRVTSTADTAPDTALEIRRGKIIRNSGIGGLALGTAMLGVGAGLEHKRRTDICKEELSDDHGDACDRSKMANITVLAMGTTIFIGGVVLLALGQTKINRAKRAALAQRVSVAPQLARGFAGAMLSARF
jgi:hypothetical protein